MQRGFPKGIILEIALYLCNDKFKVALKFMRVCKMFWEVCHEQPRFWISLYVQRYPKDFYDQYVVPLNLLRNMRGTQEVMEKMEE